MKRDAQTARSLVRVVADDVETLQNKNHREAKDILKRCMTRGVMHNGVQ